MVLYNETGLYSIHMTYNHTQIWEKREMTKSYIRLERDNSKPRRGSFLNYFWTSSIHAVCFCNCYFNFNLRNPRKAYTVSAPQEEKQSKNLTSCGPAFGRFRSGKTTWKGNSMKSRSKKLLIIKRDENTIITCQRSTDKHKQLLLLEENTQRRLSVKSLTTEIISSFPCTSQPRPLHLVHLHKPELFFLSSLGYWVSGV